jgi:hypothetical protein
MVGITAALQRTHVKKEKVTAMLMLTVLETLNVVSTIVQSNLSLALIRQMTVVTIPAQQLLQVLMVSNLLDNNIHLDYIQQTFI